MTEELKKVGSKYADFPANSLAIRECPELVSHWFMRTNDPVGFVEALQSAMVQKRIKGARRIVSRAVSNPVIGNEKLIDQDTTNE